MKNKLAYITIAFLMLFFALVLGVFLWQKNKNSAKLSENPTDQITTTKNKELIKDITPSGINGVRPDVVKIGNYFYVNFLQTKPRKSLGLVRIDDDLNTQYFGEIYSGINSFDVTDARMATDSNNDLWYPFEIASSTEKYLDLASYKIDGDSIKLLYSKDKIAQGAVLAPEKNIIPSSGAEQTDDPLPFFQNGKYYVLTRTFDAPFYKIRTFDSNLSPLDEYTLNLEPIFGRRALSVGSLSEIENKVYLITAISIGPPNSENSTSRIAAVPLASDLRSANGPAIYLTDGKEYASYVSSAKFRNGKLYILYNILSKMNSQQHQGLLEIFDVKNNFKPEKRTEIYKGDMMDLHMTMEFMENKLYVFYNTSEEKLKVKIIEE